MTLSAIIKDRTIVLDGVASGGIVWPATLYGRSISEIHAVQAYTAHSVLEYKDNGSINETFRDAEHTDTLAILTTLHSGSTQAATQALTERAAINSRLMLSIQAERDYGTITYNGRNYKATAALYSCLDIYDGMGDCTVIDADLIPVVLTENERRDLRAMIPAKMLLVSEEYAKLLL
jgi:hypothetical protein